MHRSAQKRHLTLNSGMKQKGEHIREPKHAKPQSGFCALCKKLLRRIAKVIAWVVSALASGILFDLVKTFIGF